MTIIDPFTVEDPSACPTIRPSRCGPAAASPGRAALARFDSALDAAVSDLSVHDVRAQMRLARSVKAMAEARILELSRRLTALSVAPGLGCAVDPARELRTHGGLRSRDVRAVTVQTAAVEAAPGLGDLLAAGVTTSAHVEAVGHALVAVGDDRDALLGHVPRITERAATMAVDDFDRYLKRLTRDVQTDEGMGRFRQQQRSTHVKIWNDRDGMVRLSGAFDPERGAALAGCLDRHVDTMFHTGDRSLPLDVAPGIDPNDHRRALALHHLCTRASHTDVGPAGSSAGIHGADADSNAVTGVDTRPVRAEIVVHVDLATLRSGLHGHSVCRTSHGHDLPPAVARRLACEADIIPVVLSGDSVPLDIGRAKRLATVHQRRALESRHTTCAIHHCDTPFSRCVVHHLDPWEHGGPTSLDNLVPLCTRHHHDVHDNGWRLSLDPITRHLTVTLPGVPVPDAVDGLDPPP